MPSVSDFIQDFYNTLESKGKLGDFYRKHSLTFEGIDFKGISAIEEKYASLPSGIVRYKVDTLDFHRLGKSQDGFSSALVTGILDGMFPDDEKKTASFAHSFVLGQTITGKYYIEHDSFRMI